VSLPLADSHSFLGKLFHHGKGLLVVEGLPTGARLIDSAKWPERPTSGLDTRIE
jgi:hypothetical protein